MSDTIELDNKNLLKLMKAFKGETPRIRVGIIGGTKNARTEGDGPTNAEVGAAHEFGTEHLPVRSWLRMPLMLKLNEMLQEGGAFDTDVIKKIIKDGTIKTWARQVGITGEAAIHAAFATGGFGRWRMVNMTRKETKQILVETRQLERSVTSEVD